MTLSWTSRPHRQVVYSFRFWVDAVVDVWFILDVLVNFRTSFEITEGSNRGKLEISRKVRDRAALWGKDTLGKHATRRRLCSRQCSASPHCIEMTVHSH